MSHAAEPVNEFAVMLSPQVLSWPYPYYDQLRSEDPIHWSAALGLWMFTRYDDVASALSDARFSNNWPATFHFARPLTEEEQQSSERLLKIFGMWMQAADPPRHNRIRGLVQKAFTPRVLNHLQQQIRVMVDQLLDAVQPAGEMDLIADLAYPLPVMVISEMLGVPHQYRDQFKDCAGAMSAFIGSPNPAPGQLQGAEKCIQTAFDLLEEVINERKVHPREDLLSSLVQVDDLGDVLTTQELLSNCALILSAGHETTTNLIGNGTLALLRNPDQWQLLQDHPDCASTAVEELLRYDSPVQWIARNALQDFEMGGKSFLKGQHIWLGLGAANYDPAHFTDPHRLDLTREEDRSLSFSHGIHHCLGASLARMEAQIVLTTLARRMPGLKLKEEAMEWAPNFFIRGVKALPVSF